MMDREWLEERYHLTGAYCKDCGRLLKSSFGEPLGRYFVMDKSGNYYCTKCDTQFDDVDDRIYVAMEDEEDEL